MLSGCTIVHTLVPFRMQEVEELCDTDFEFYFDFKVPPDIRNRQISRRIKRPPSQRISNEMAVSIFIMV